MKEALDFLTAPLGTDELKRQVDDLRGLLEDKAAEELRLGTDLTDVNLDLDRMEAKTSFLVSMAGQLLDLSMPPPAEGLEAVYDARKADLYDPMQQVTAVVGVAGLGAMALGKLVLPGTLKVVGFVSRSARVSDAAKSVRLVKLAKMGRASVYLAIGASILELAIKMTDARKINAYLTEKREEFQSQVAEANRVLARYEVAIEQGQALRDRLLADAGVETVNEYLGLLNDAIKDMAEQATKARMTRNLLRMGKSTEEIAELMPHLESSVIDGIARRLAAEIALLEGASPESVAEETGLTALQTGVVRRILDARGDAALGFPDAALVARHGISDAVADLQIDLAEAALPGIWPALEGEGSLSGASVEALIPEAALIRLRREMQVRGALWAGEEAEALFARFEDVDPARVAELAEELAVEKETARRDPLAPDALMIALRLPSDSVRVTAA